MEQIEGDKVEGVAMIEFPTMELARGWYERPAYRRLSLIVRTVLVILE
jgi:uncharacterized protein (DUF1330 family)